MAAADEGSISGESRLLSGKVALVTGASRGIGYATAIALAKRGAHVIAAARILDDLKKLEGEIRKVGGVSTLVSLDLRHHDAIDDLGVLVRERHKRLDVLVGNAGLLGRNIALDQVDPGVWNDLMAVNVTANWRLIRAFDAILRAAEAARVVFVTSGAGRPGIGAYWGPYAVSKAALDNLASIYAVETAQTEVKVNLFAPGPIRTDMRAAAAPDENPLTLDTPDQAAEHILRMCLPSWQESGKYYDYPTKTLLELQQPKPAAEARSR